MAERASTAGTGLEAAADTALKAAARFWFLTALVGQWIFVYYVAAFYGGAAVQGRWESWNKIFPRGHVPGDAMGNAAVFLHLLFAVIVVGGGPLQLIPRVRAKFPTFHRWNGRVYMLAVCATSLVGLYMVWVRGGTTGDVVQHLGITLDALLILAFAVQATRTAMARQFEAHRRWALRLFMVVSAVWFFRVGLMFWIFINKGPAGFNPKTFTGPFLNVLTFAQTLLPLAVLELYLRARDRSGALHRFSVAAGLAALTVAMGVGIFAASLIMWLPNLS
jgi:uncharacterized membrane protein